MPPIKPSVDVNADTRVSNPIDIPKPADTSNYDFESHGVPSETDLHSSSGMGERLPSDYTTAATEAMPANKGPLASKIAGAKSPLNSPAKPLKTIAQDVAGVKAPDAPVKPLEGQGVKASGPVEPAFYNEAGKQVSKPNMSKPVRKITPPKVESSNPAPAAEKVMTPEGSVEKVAGTTPVKASGVAETGMEAAVKRSVPNGSAKLAGRLAAHETSAAYQVPAAPAEEAGASLASKAGSALKGLGSLAKGAGEAADDLLLGGATKPYRALMAKRAAGTAAKSGVKAIGGEALALGEGAVRFGGNVAKGVAVQAAAQGGYKLGTAAKEGLDEAKSNAESQKRQGANYGLKVESSADTKDSSNFLGQTARDVGNAVKTAAGFSDPTPSVSVDPALKAKFLASNKKRIQGLQDQGVVPRQYARATIKGNTGIV
jgi:hypothetical protein